MKTDKLFDQRLCLTEDSVATDTFVCWSHFVPNWWQTITRIAISVMSYNITKIHDVNISLER